MFICHDCKKPVGPYIQQIRVITERRDKTYLNNGKTSHGWEIAKEVNVCEPCFVKNHQEVTIQLR